MSKKSPIRRRTVLSTSIDPRQARATLLDRLADAELQHGHHLAAERLAHAAAELRDGAGGRA